MQTPNQNDFDASLLAIEMQQMTNKTPQEIAIELIILRARVDNVENTLSKILNLLGEKK